MVEAVLTQAVNPNAAKELLTNPIGSIYNYLLGSISIVVALAWNDAFASMFKNDPRLKSHGPWVYAISVSIVGAMAVYVIMESSKVLHVKV